MPWLSSAACPVRIRLEADTSVDDVVVHLADDSKAFIQAKNASGLDAPFKSAVEQWCRAIQEGQCSDKDRLLFVVAEPAQVLRDLARHLRDFQNGACPTNAASTSLAKLRTEISKHGLSESSTELVMKLADIRFIDARDLGPYEGQGGAWLDASVVQAGYGMAAFKALRAAVRDSSAYRESSSDLNKWRDWLKRATIPLVSDTDGILAARLQAEDEAIASYRQELAKYSDVLPLADFNFGVTSLPVPGLAKGLKATYINSETKEDKGRQDEKGLLKLMRREGRILLVGRPGAGKSVALNLIAAEWAAASHAPVPIRARLADLAQQLPSSGPYRLPVQAFCMSATNGSDPTLESALARYIQRGEALLLLDGLDEVQGKQDAVIEAIANSLEEFPDSVDVVISSRHSSSDAAAALGLPALELDEPENLDATLNLLLEKLAEARGTQASEWLDARRSFIEKSRKSDRPLWEVPLLSTLMVFLLAERSPNSMPASRAGLLVEIIESSVYRWESRRATTGIPGIQESLTSQVLLDCYDDIAHHVTQGSASWSTVLEALEARLRDYWGRPPGEARAAAKGILNHWDATAGVFLTDYPYGTLTARTRLFAEIGEARWVIRDEGRATEWLKGAVSDSELRESVRLAAGLSSPVIQLLCDLAIAQREDLLDLALSAIEDGAEVDLDRENAIKDAQIERVGSLPLTPQHTRIGNLKVPGHSAAAKLAVRLARTRLEENSRHKLIARTSRLGSWQTSVVESLSLAWRAERNGLRPTTTELDLMEEALLGVNEEEDSKNKPAGLDDLVKFAIRELVPARPSTAVKVAAAAYKCRVSTASYAEDALTRLGHEDSIKRARPESYFKLPESAKKVLSSLGDFDRDTPFNLMARLSDNPITLTPMQAWHLDEAAALVQAVNLNYAGIGNIGQAFTDSSSVTLRLFHAIALARKIDVGAVVAEIISLKGENPERPDWWILAVPCLRRPIPNMTSPAGSSSLIMEAFSTGNDWLADLAVQLAWDADFLSEEWRDDLVSLLPSLPASLRRLAGIVIAKQWPATSPPADAATRSGFARVTAARLTNQQFPEGAVRLLKDPGLLVREEAAELLKEIPGSAKGPLVEALSFPATQWTCIACDQVFDIEVSVCRNRHNRPDPSVVD